MRLLNSSTYQLHESEFFKPDIPPYAILSHTWEEEEVSFQDFQGSFANDFRAKQGFDKVKRGCDQAAHNRIQWVWIDTCCIDKLNSAELSEAINSMYGWFEDALVCFAHLSDVPSTGDNNHSSLRNCKWFTRKWTLQELVAPPVVEFYNKDWVLIGTRTDLHRLISEITGIPAAVLTGEKKPKECHVSERMNWTSNRTAASVEDEAYSIMGLFDMKQPILYGEGSRASRRLEDGIRNTYYTATIGMRLLVTNSRSLKFRNFAATDSPAYAILSHTWGKPEDELTMLDVHHGRGKRKIGYQKVKKCCELAAEHGFEYLWVDTCCIDKASSAELQEAICSMYRWYKMAQICYVYLEDCPVSSSPPNFWDSRWFERGWTLQELIAPTFVEFYNQSWIQIGTKRSLCNHISQVTGIDPIILRGSDPTKRTVAERMSWAASRSTTRIEDAAYCLMGLFNVFMPMLYGEGIRSFTRLQEEIMKQSEDYTIFAWKASGDSHRGLLARSPDEFIGHTTVASRDDEAEYEHDYPPPTLTSRGLMVHLPLLLEPSQGNKYLAWLCCSKSGKTTQNSRTSQGETLICVWLRKIRSSPPTFVRILPNTLESLPGSAGSRFTRQKIYVKTVSDEEPSEIDNTRSGMFLVHFPQMYGAKLLPTPIATLGNRFPDVNWKSPLSNELLYSYHAKTCLLAAFTLENAQEQLVVLIGFRDHLPCCAVVTLEELGCTANNQLARAEFMKKLFELENFELLSSSHTDRSSKPLSNGTTIMVAVRPGCPTPLNPTVFNLELRDDTGSRNPTNFTGSKRTLSEAGLEETDDTLYPSSIPGNGHYVRAIQSS